MKWVLVNNMDEIVDTCEIASGIGVSGAKTYFMGIKRLKGKEFDSLWRVMSQEKYDLQFKASLQYPSSLRRSVTCSKKTSL